MTTHPNQDAFPRGISGPALRALDRAGIRAVGELRAWSEADLAALRGMGSKALATVGEARAASGGAFRQT